jgi:hypothetical protein
LAEKFEVVSIYILPSYVSIARKYLTQVEQIVFPEGRRKDSRREIGDHADVESDTSSTWAAA